MVRESGVPAPQRDRWPVFARFAAISHAGASSIAPPSVVVIRPCCPPRAVSAQYGIRRGRLWPRALLTLVDLAFCAVVLHLHTETKVAASRRRSQPVNRATSSPRVAYASGSWA